MVQPCNYFRSMSNNYFKFKQFTIEQEGCAMKVGTDGCLLGAWFCTDGSQRILDIGSGTGLISMMAAQRCNAKIVGIEIDAIAAERAKANANKSPWGNRIEIIHSDLQNYTSEEPFDTIVSNPPYFSNSLKCDNEQRSLARHDDSLSPALFFTKSQELLSCKGKISLILPTDTIDKWINEATFKGFSTHRITQIQTTPRKAPKRALIELRRDNCIAPQKEILILESSPGRYSDEACRLLRDFYLKID